MSKIREELPEYGDSFEPGEEPDLKPYVCFTQLKKDGPYIYAGWLDAADDEMAMNFALQHYGRDQVATGIWVIPREAIAGTEPDYAPAESQGDDGTQQYQVFTQQRNADGWISGPIIEAANPAAALETAMNQIDEPQKVHAVWVVRTAEIIHNDSDDLLWRYSDQSYRLARGYSKRVRQKWDKIRAEEDIEEYEKEDLKEAF